MSRFFKNFRMQGTNLEIMKFAICVTFPIGTMIWVGNDTHEKFNVPNFWPDPSTLHRIPKTPEELQAELARMRAARAEKRARLEREAQQMSIVAPTQEELEARELEGMKNRLKVRELAEQALRQKQEEEEEAATAAAAAAVVATEAVEVSSSSAAASA
ncbi:uncharacterized protein SAPINGB_P006117 [Magnusiomyces paraingens]|uniref:Uncharacterized protein n=1 Tax=Magnusiomyces paraingens TaxID=2606893 RepID=A0A5E8C5B9_9ASCO|nr:uncharacterized protein SAPINGB_P006117 [Saprochaete ingens]VVT58260.1 unnamed protein product [Saprochaete ingens]